MSHQPQTSEKWKSELQKFKTSKPEYLAGATWVTHQKWNDEFLNLKLSEAWKQGMLDAKKIIEDAKYETDLALTIMDEIDDAAKENATPP